jgi:DivIVA domain-containing protein
MNDADPCDPVLNGDEVRNITFGKGLYDASQVDDLLGRIAAELDAGRPAGPLIASATFKQRPFARGYNAGAVNWFLEQLWRREDPAEADRMNADPWRDLAADPYCIHREPGDPVGHVARPSKQACADAWNHFARQPGTRLSWVRTGALRHELRTADQQAVASFLGWLLSATLTAGGRTFTWREVNRSSWPGIAKTISREYPYAPAHMRKRQAENQTDGTNPVRQQLLDETRIPILYTAGGHSNGSAGGYIKFPGQRWLRFPVRGTGWTDAIMTAVDQAGNKVARYRLVRDKRRFWKTTEITVHPDQRLTEELALAIAASAPWLSSYFRQEGGGG